MSITLRKGTLLYRAGPQPIEMWQCSDTNKFGVYFATYPMQSLGMVIEYKRNMLVGVFRTTADMLLTPGKYTRYSWNHCDWTDPTDFQLQGATLLDMVVFIGDPDDIQKVELLRTYDVSYVKLKHYMETRCLNITPHTPILQHFPWTGTIEPVDTAEYTLEDYDTLLRLSADFRGDRLIG